MLFTYLPFKSFLDLSLSRDASADNISLCYLDENEQGDLLFPMLVYNDRLPRYWSSYDDRTVVFDAYDQAVETTLQSNKTMCWGYKARDLPILDDSVPALPEQLTSLLVAQAKDKAFEIIKQYRSKVLAREARKQEVKAQSYKARTDDHKQLQITFPDFGRK